MYATENRFYSMPAQTRKNNKLLKISQNNTSAYINVHWGYHHIAAVHILRCLFPTSTEEVKFYIVKPQKYEREKQFEVKPCFRPE